MDGTAPESLLDSYDHERVYGAEENILNSTRATDFITPKSEVSRVFRNAVLDLAEQYAFARPLVNSGRLSVPCVYDGSPLNGADHPMMPARTRPGSPACDAPLNSAGGKAWLLAMLGNRFQLLGINTEIPEHLETDGIKIECLPLSAKPGDPLGERYLGEAKSAVYLIRPDQHVAARFETFDEDQVITALKTAIGKNAANRTERKTQ